jgi:hypothetical protein
MEPESPHFRVVWRGYDRRQVDEHVRMLQAMAKNRASGQNAPGGGSAAGSESGGGAAGESALDGMFAGDSVPGDEIRPGDPLDDRLEEALSAAPPEGFDVVLRGYDRREVEQYIMRLGQ